MSEATQTANSTDARQASMSRVSTQETLLGKLQTQEAAKEPPEVKTEGEQTKDEGEGKPKKSAQERIQELATKRKEAEAKADAAERRAAVLEAQVQALQASAPPMTEAARPLRSQFVTDDDFIEALTDHKAKQAIREREEEQAKARADAEQADIAASWSKRQDAAMKRYPDYADVLGKSEVNIPSHIHEALLDSEQGPDIAFYLASYPEEAKRIAQMKPSAAIKRIRDLERDMEAISAEEAEPEPKAAAPKVEKSKAPPPIEPIKSAPGSSGSTSSFEDYKRRRESERRK